MTCSNHTLLCTACQRNITKNNFARHTKSCLGPKVSKVRGVDYDPNHGYVNGTRTAWNKGLTKDTDGRVAQNGNAVSKAKEGKPPTGCAAWSREKRSVEAKKLGLGGYRERAGRSQKFRVLDSFGKETVLQSSFELKCSEVLNALGINWVRPGALKYDSKNYFADFYLVDYDIWLDPKNAYKAKMDHDKINKVIDQNQVNLYVLLEEQITEEYITSLIQW